MKLRAKKPVINDPRLKTLLYASEGVGKTHFCCSFPDTYYIDSEGLEDYPHLVKMIHDNNGDMVYLTDLEEIIKEVQALLSTPHDYKTLIIDSISFPYAWLAQMEAERLAKKTRDTEGTEYGANLAKAKRLTFQLGILLSRLDMNVIVLAHEKVKYQDGKEIGTVYDVTDKMAYSLGSVWNLKLQGKSRKLYVKKSRYENMKSGETLDFDNGYEVIKGIFGEEIFKRKAETKELCTTEQVTEFNRLVQTLHISDERVNKLLTASNAMTLNEIEKAHMTDLIEKLKKQITDQA